MRTIKIHPYAAPGILANKTLEKEAIIMCVCEYFDISEESLKGISRQTKFTFPRFICMYLLKREINTDFRSLGKMFNRDHTTVINAVQKIEDFISINDQKTKVALNEIRSYFFNHLVKS